MASAPEREGDIVYALVCLRSGIVLDTLGRPSADRVRGCAAAAPELFRPDGKAMWASLFGRLGGDAGAARFREFILIAAGQLHVIERLGRAADVALVAVSSENSNLAVVLSAFRSRLAELERESA